jgi:hypothetical protein
LLTDSEPVRSMTDHLVRQAVQDSHILVVPHHSFFKYLDRFTVEDLKAKTVITSTVYDDRIDYLKDKGVDVIIDTTPKLLEECGRCERSGSDAAGCLRYPQGRGERR